MGVPNSRGCQILGGPRFPMTPGGTIIVPWTVRGDHFRGGTAFEGGLSTAWQGELSTLWTMRASSRKPSLSTQLFS